MQSAVVFLSHFCEVHGPTILMCTSIEKSVDVNHTPSTTSETSSPSCCLSLGSVSVVTSSKSDGEPIFLSRGQSRVTPEMYATLRRTCLRSLSVEVCPGGEGAVLFPDGEGGNAVSYVFRLSDVKARGGRRLVSLVFLASDRDALLSVWDEVVGQLHRTASEWRARAHRRYIRERQMVDEIEEKGPARSSRPWPAATHTAPVRHGQLRSFADLFSVPGLELWHRLHVSHCVALMGFMRRVATIRIGLKGPIVDVPILSRETGEDTEQCNCGRDIDVAESIRSLSPLALGVFIYNLVVGNQVIVRSKHKECSLQIVNWLSSLIPEQCCRAIPYASTYSDVWVSNIIGVSGETRLPRHVAPPEYSIMDIVCPGDALPKGGGSGLKWEGVGAVSVLRDDDLDDTFLPALPGAESADFFASFDAGTPPDAGGPMDDKADIAADTADSVMVGGHQWVVCGAGGETKLGVALVRCALDPMINDISRSVTLASLKYAWIAKAEAFKQFLRCPNADNTVRVYRFLDAVHCTAADLPVIRFWATNSDLKIGLPFRESKV